MAIQPQDLKRVYDHYNGMNIWIRSKHMGVTSHYNRAKVLRVSNARLEVLPQNHHRPEWVHCENVLWWQSQMRRFHPDFDNVLTNTIGQTSYIVDPDQKLVWGGFKNQFTTVPEQWKAFTNTHAARTTVGRLKRQYPSILLLSEIDVQALLRPIPIEVEVKVEPELEPEPILPVIADSVCPATEPDDSMEKSLSDLQYAWELFSEAILSVIQMAKRRA